MNHVISLNEQQQTLCESLAVARLLLNQYRKLTNRNYGDRDPMHLARDGLGAELAHEILRGRHQAPANLTIVDGRGGKDYDTEYKRWKLDVKSLRGAKLLVDERQLLTHIDCDGYGFFRADWPAFEWLGYVSRLLLHSTGAVDGKYTVPPEMLKDDILKAKGA